MSITHHSSLPIFIIIISDDAAVSGQPGEGVHHLLLDEVDGHGEYGEPQQDVDHADKELVLAVSRVNIRDGVSRDKVSKPDGSEGDEGEVEPLDKGPIFPGREQNSTCKRGKTV